MAIIRCPYCHAIIDENDKYCNNCGTQLLFPEDDEVEEEIPGEKIVDVEEDEEEKDYTLAGPEEEAPPGADEEEKGDATAEERTGELITGPVEPPATGELKSIIEEEAEAAGGDEEPEEVIVVDEIASREAAEPMETGGLPEVKPGTPETPAAPEEETKAYPVSAPQAAPADDESVEMPGPAAPATAPVEEEAVEGEGRARTGAPAEEEAEVRPAVPPTFDTRELDGIGRTVELGKERVDKMISAMAEKQKEEAAALAAVPAPEKRTGSLPPWAARIKGGAVPDEPRSTPDTGRRFAADRAQEGAGGEEPAGTEEAEEEIFPRRKPSDSGIGLPERIAQATLPFGAAAEEAEEEPAAAGPPPEAAAEPQASAPAAAPAAAFEPRPSLSGIAAAAPAAGAEAETEEEEPRPPFRFSVFFKAKAFDVLFVGVFWLVALWVAARSMDATLFEILSVTSGPVLVLYGVYIGLYFFLFKFFLGETLGDRLFRERD